MLELKLSRGLEELVREEFIGLHSGGPRSSIRGGQSAANRALEQLNISGYAAKRSQVLPKSARGASVLSPYIRHNLLGLKQVWDAVGGAKYDDREKFRDELLWQEYARHLYARIGEEFFQNLKFDQVWNQPGDGWNTELMCIDTVVSELESDGWLVNQTRMWLASHWTVRNGRGWVLGQERMYRELIDGSRAANLLGWQWTVGSAGKPYGFARWQVEKRAPGLCGKCPLNKNCPIQEFPEEKQLIELEPWGRLRFDDNLPATTGPTKPVISQQPEMVLLTVDSMGDADPALAANPDLPVAFVFNRPALAKLQLSAKRIFFYLETLEDLAQRREVLVYLGDTYEFASQHRVALTYAPVPSFKKFSQPAALYPFPWLKAPHAKSIGSFSAWRRGIEA